VRERKGRNYVLTRPDPRFHAGEEVKWIGPGAWRGPWRVVAGPYWPVNAGRGGRPLPPLAYPAPGWSYLLEDNNGRYVVRESDMSSVDQGEEVEDVTDASLAEQEAENERSAIDLTKPSAQA
jgi:hypothetical protein